MATDVGIPEQVQAIPKLNRFGWRPYRLTVEQFLKMIDAGVFREGSHVELLGGRLIEKLTKNDPHNFGVGEIAARLRDCLPAGWFVREEKSLNLDRWSRPEPDVVVVRGARQDYRRRAPGPKDVALLIEVADTSYAKDRTINWRSYAAAQVPNYWILNIHERRIEVYGDPAGKGTAAAYRSQTIFGEAAEIPVTIEGAEVGRIAVRDVLA